MGLKEHNAVFSSASTPWLNEESREWGYVDGKKPPQKWEQ